MAKIGLVLSGGMAKGAYQVGALNAIRERFEPSDFACVSAASIGTLNAYAFLNGLMPEAEKMWLSVSSNANYKWIVRTMKSAFIEKIANEIVTKDAIKNRFFVPLFDFNSRTLTYKDLSSVEVNKMSDYLTASVAMPFCSPGVDIDGCTYYDGAMVDNIPAFPLLDQELDYIICIYFDSFDYIFENEEFSKKIIKVTFPDNTVISNSVVLSEERTRFMMREGYEQTVRILDSIFFNGYDDLEFIRKKMLEIGFEKREQKTRITGDFLVSNINRAAKHIAKRVKE